jgi:hypothetical protein
MTGSRDTRLMGIYAELKVRGQAVTLADPSGGKFDAAGDFDQLLPVPEDIFPVLARIDPYGEVTIRHPDLAALAAEAAYCSARRLKALSGAACSGSVLWP